MASPSFDQLALIAPLAQAVRELGYAQPTPVQEQAIPLVLAGNMLQIRIGKLQDGVQEELGEFLDHLAAVQSDTA